MGEGQKETTLNVCFKAINNLLRKTRYASRHFCMLLFKSK